MAFTLLALSSPKGLKFDLQYNDFALGFSHVVELREKDGREARVPLDVWTIALNMGDRDEPSPDVQFIVFLPQDQPSPPWLYRSPRSTEGIAVEAVIQQALDGYVAAHPEIFLPAAVPKKRKSAPAAAQKKQRGK